MYHDKCLGKIIVSILGNILTNHAVLAKLLLWKGFNCSMKKFLITIFLLFFFHSTVIFSQNEEIKPFACNRNFTLLINEYGELNYIQKELHSSIINVSLKERFKQVGITQNFALALTEEGDLFESNIEGERLIFTVNKYFRGNVKNICSVPHFAVLLTKEGDVYFKGFLDFYYTTKKRSRYYRKSTSVHGIYTWHLLKEKCKKIRHIEVGQDNIFLIDNTSRIFCYGHKKFRAIKNIFSMFPAEDKFFKFSQIKFKFDEKVRKIFDLGTCILLLTDEGQVYGMGSFGFFIKGRIEYKNYKKFIALFKGVLVENIVKTKDDLFLFKSCEKKYLKIPYYDDEQYIFKRRYEENGLEKFCLNAPIKNSFFDETNFTCYLIDDKGQLHSTDDGLAFEEKLKFKLKVTILWSFANHSHFSKEFKNKIFNFLLIERRVRDSRRMKIPKGVLGIIFAFVSNDPL